MGKIKILPKKTASKIAAGEVIERPASVVKELVENAIDAKATRIKIEIEKGGINKISVIDNGEGMDKKDIEQCFKQHGTSKLFSENDLHHITSMGFRGEALYSITAVSQTKIRSKIKTDLQGTIIELSEGKINHISPIGMPTGTHITVNQLFFNLPARKKFLKTPATEFRHITDIIVNNALAFPKIAFYLSHNKRVVFDLPENQNLTERANLLLGKSLSQYFIPLQAIQPHLKISGLITKPQASRETQAQQYIYVNNRRIKNKIITVAVKQAYGNLLAPQSYPLFILFLNILPDLIDVNIHPRKEEVKFINSQQIFNGVKIAVSKALETHKLTYIKQTPDKYHPFSFKKQPVYPKPTISYLKDSPIPFRKKSFKTETTKLPWETDDQETTKQLDILQIHKLYLIYQTPTGLCLIDQHAAHERILYEQLLADFKKKKKKANTQPLLVAETFDLSASESLFLKKHLEIFNKLGFEIEEFGQNSFKINSLPHVLENQNGEILIKEVLDDLLENKTPRKIDKKNQKIISFLACRSAIKANDFLTLEKRQTLINQLNQTKTNYTCPHGRPVKIEISLKELDKMFKRR